MQEELAYGCEGVINKIHQRSHDAFGEARIVWHSWLRATLARMGAKRLEDLSYRQLLDVLDLVDLVASNRPKGPAE